MLCSLSYTPNGQLLDCNEDEFVLHSTPCVMPFQHPTPNTRHPASNTRHPTPKPQHPAPAGRHTLQSLTFHAWIHLLHPASPSHEHLMLLTLPILRSSPPASPLPIPQPSPIKKMPWVTLINTTWLTTWFALIPAAAGAW